MSQLKEPTYCKQDRRSHVWQLRSGTAKKINKYAFKKEKEDGDFPGNKAVKTVLPLQGVQVQSLVGELRSCMPSGEAKKGKKEMQHIYYSGT